MFLRGQPRKNAPLRCLDILPMMPSFIIVLVRDVLMPLELYMSVRYFIDHRSSMRCSPGTLIFGHLSDFLLGHGDLVQNIS